MKIIFNGVEVTLNESSTIKELATLKKVNIEHCVAELNGEILPRGTFDEVNLKEGDALELIRFVGGGSK